MKIPLKSFLGSLTAVALSFAPGLPAQTANPTVLYTAPDTGSSNLSVYPRGTLTQDGAGNFYGTTQDGGENRLGSIYKLTPAGDYSTVFSFAGNGHGVRPRTGVFLGADGYVYGTTAFTDVDQSGGGTQDPTILAGTGAGTVFKLSPAGVLTTLHVFGGGTDGGSPKGDLIQGPDGRLYGTTSLTVYAITTDGALTNLHTFPTSGEGTFPQSGLVLARDGNFYGTTAYDVPPNGVATPGGSVFKITPAGVYTLLHHINGSSDGGLPLAGLVQGSDGNFYGSTRVGGAHGTGTIFQVTPAGVFTVLHTFSNVRSSADTDDGYPVSTLVDGGDGKFYGLTDGNGDGTNYSSGSFFSITPSGVLTTLYTFPMVDSGFVNTSGANNVAGLFKAADGKFYVPMPYGGANGSGTIVAFTVIDSPSAFFTDEVPLTNGVYYLSFPGGNTFGYYEYLSDPHFIYHFDLGFEYVFDAADGVGGMYLYDFASSTFFYTSPVFPFPYLYDFSRSAFLYYFPDTTNPGHYTSNPRSFYDFNAGVFINK